jgi:hypothetical protein
LLPTPTVLRVLQRIANDFNGAPRVANHSMQHGCNTSRLHQVANIAT